MALPHLRWKFVFACCGCLLLVAAALGQSTETTQSSMTKVADDVYMIRHADALNGFPQGNTTVIIGGNSVLVVDACYLPASAKEDIAAIRRLTSKPVTYLVNTHYHLDHTNGNAAYREAFPAISIIGREDTRYLVEKNNKMEVERTKNYYQLLQTFQKSWLASKQFKARLTGSRGATACARASKKMKKLSTILSKEACCVPHLQSWKQGSEASSK
jgi:hypothetical protein